MKEGFNKIRNLCPTRQTGTADALNCILIYYKYLFGLCEW